MESDIKDRSKSLPPGRPELNLIRTQKRLLLQRIFEIIRDLKGIELSKLIAKMYIEEGFSKKTAKEYIEMLYHAEYITIDGDKSIVKVKREFNAAT